MYTEINETFMSYFLCPDFILRYLKQRHFLVKEWGNELEH